MPMADSLNSGRMSAWRGCERLVNNFPCEGARLVVDTVPGRLLGPLQTRCEKQVMKCHTGYEARWITQVTSYTGYEARCHPG